jgi:Flp pilus assembly protein CpaB
VARTAVQGQEESTTTMKRNMVPLLGIAFVVAIISTGVFYGLFAGKLRSSSELPGHAIVVAAHDLDRGTVIQPSDLRISEVQGVLGGSFSKPEDAAGATLLASMKANEPLLEDRVSQRASQTGGVGGLVPSGMRAVSMHVFQSESVLNMLRPGSRVDLQAVSEINGAAELRTVRENVQVLSLVGPDANGNRPAGAVITVLLRAEDADMVALADAGSRIRLALRNPTDEETIPRHSLTLAALFSGKIEQEADRPESVRQVTALGWDHPVQLRVWVLEATDTGLEELQTQSAEVAAGSASGVSAENSWRVAAFQSGDQAAKLVHNLEQKQQLEVVSSERLMAGVGRPISYRAGAKPYQLRVQFAPELLPTGKLGLRVKPHIGEQSTDTATKKYEASLPDASSSLLLRLANDPSGQNSAARLFPGRSWEHKHLVIFVSTQTIQLSSTAAVARNTPGKNRGQ